MLFEAVEAAEPSALVFLAKLDAWDQFVNNSKQSAARMLLEMNGDLFRTRTPGFYGP